MITSRLLFQDMSFFDDNKNGVGILTTRLANDATTVQGVGSWCSVCYFLL